MSGICGVVYQDSQRSMPQDLMAHVGASMLHRGLHDAAYHVEAGAGFGIQHLAVCPNRQVFATNQSETVTVLIDGNLYNAADLRCVLEKKGHTFATTCPFEVVPHLYQEYGIHFLEHLNGDFGMALWDRERRLLLLARDRFGVKPLYFAVADGALWFASSLRAMLRYPVISTAIDPLGYSEYLTFQHTISPRTLLVDVSRLPAGHYAIYQDGTFSMHQYWDLHFPDEATKLQDEATHVEQFREAFARSIALRSADQEQIGVFLSGGMDSSSLVGMLAAQGYARIHTYTGGWYTSAAQTSEELDRARIVAEHFKTHHHEIPFSAAEYLKALPRFVEYMDDLVADEAAPIRMLLAEGSAPDVRVILGGEGGDDITGGYKLDDMQRRFDRVRRFQQIPPVLRVTLPMLVGPILPPRLRAWLARGNRDIATVLPEEHHTVTWAFDMAEKRHCSPALEGVEDHCHDLLRTFYAASGTRDPISQALYIATKIWLAENLMTNADRMLASYGLDYRAPFLDHELVSLAATIPSSLKVRRTADGSYMTKYILRRTVEHLLPARIMQMPKSPFQVPLDRWFESAMDACCQDYLGENARHAGFCDPPAFFNLLQQYRQAPTLRSMIQLRNLLFFEMWRQTVLVAP